MGSLPLPQLLQNELANFIPDAQRMIDHVHQPNLKPGDKPELVCRLLNNCNANKAALKKLLPLQGGLLLAIQTAVTEAVNLLNSGDVATLTPGCYVQLCNGVRGLLALELGPLAKSLTTALLAAIDDPALYLPARPWEGKEFAQVSLFLAAVYQAEPLSPLAVPTAFLQCMSVSTNGDNNYDGWAYANILDALSDLAPALGANAVLPAANQVASEMMVAINMHAKNDLSPYDCAQAFEALLKLRQRNVGVSGAHWRFVVRAMLTAIAGLGNHSALKDTYVLSICTTMHTMVECGLLAPGEPMLVGAMAVLWPRTYGKSGTLAAEIQALIDSAQESLQWPTLQPDDAGSKSAATTPAPKKETVTAAPVRLTSGARGRGRAGPTPPRTTAKVGAEKTLATLRQCENRKQWCDEVLKQGAAEALSLATVDDLDHWLAGLSKEPHSVAAMAVISKEVVKRLRQGQYLSEAPRLLFQVCSALSAFGASKEIEPVLRQVCDAMVQVMTAKKAAFTLAWVCEVVSALSWLSLLSPKDAESLLVLAAKAVPGLGASLRAEDFDFALLGRITGTLQLISAFAPQTVDEFLVALASRVASSASGYWKEHKRTLALAEVVACQLTGDAVIALIDALARKPFGVNRDDREARHGAVYAMLASTWEQGSDIVIDRAASRRVVVAFMCGYLDRTEEPMGSIRPNEQVRRYAAGAALSWIGIQALRWSEIPDARAKASTLSKVLMQLALVQSKLLPYDIAGHWSSVFLAVIEKLKEYGDGKEVLRMLNLELAGSACAVLLNVLYSGRHIDESFVVTAEWLLQAMTNMEADQQSDQPEDAVLRYRGVFALVSRSVAQARAALPVPTINPAQEDTPVEEPDQRESSSEED